MPGSRGNGALHESLPHRSRGDGGKREFDIEQEHAIELLNSFLGLNFLDFRDYYTRREYVELDDGAFVSLSEIILDMQEVALSLSYRDHNKTVVVAYNGPTDFDRIVFEFERLTNLEQLIGEKLGGE